MGYRIKRVNNLIQEVLAKIFLKELDLPKEILVTITRVETSPDLNEAKVFISVFPEKEREKIIENLKKNVYFFQKKLDKKLVMERVPKISFLIEGKTVEAGRIEEIIAKIQEKERCNKGKKKTSSK